MSLHVQKLLTAQAFTAPGFSTPFNVGSWDNLGQNATGRLFVQLDLDPTATANAVNLQLLGSSVESEFQTKYFVYGSMLLSGTAFQIGGTSTQAWSWVASGGKFYASIPNLPLRPWMGMVWTASTNSGSVWLTW